MTEETTIQRIFVPGDQWLYYKIYCGARTADRIILEFVKPMALELFARGLIDKWFFIRYQDPEEHLRIRFLMKSNEYVSQIMHVFNESTRGYVEASIIHKVQLDTYQREIERYGQITMEVSESFFHEESQAVIELIEEANEIMFFVKVLSRINSYLNEFGFSLDEKIAFTEVNKEAYKKEFQVNKFFTKEVEKKYKRIGDQIKEELQSEKELLGSNVQEYIQEILKIKHKKQLEVTFEDLLSSYIHMFVNRAFRSKQRLYELVVYSLLVKYYKEVKFSS